MNYDVILRQHVEDSALHWVAFQEACDTQPTGHPDIEYYGKRLQPHLMGLGLALDQAWPIALETLVDNADDADAVFVAMWIALNTAKHDIIAQVAQFAGGSHETAMGALGAVHWVSAKQMGLFVKDWLDQDDPLLHAMALRLCRLHGSAPPHLRDDLRHSSAVVRSEAATACAALAPDLFKDSLSDVLKEPNLNGRLATALTAAEMGYRDEAVQTLKDIAQTDCDAAGRSRD